MTIYVDDGEAVKIYTVKAKTAKAVMTLLETDNELVWSETPVGYGVAIVDKTKSSQMTNEKATKTLSTEPCDRIEYGTDGNAYKMSISNGKEFETCVDRGV